MSGRSWGGGKQSSATDEVCVLPDIQELYKHLFFFFLGHEGRRAARDAAEGFQGDIHLDHIAMWGCSGLFKAWMC